MPAAPPVSVGASGATINTGAAKLVYAAGAYASSTSVIAAWIDRKHIASASGPVQFLDAAGDPQRLVGVVHVEAPSEPAVPVTVTVPLPPGVTSVTAHHLDPATYAWSMPIKPTSVANGAATFSIPSFDDVCVAEPSTGDFMLTDGSCTGTDASGQAFTAATGDVIASGSTIQPSADTKVLDASGHETTQAPGSSVTLDASPAAGTITETCSSEVCSTTVTSTEPPGGSAPLKPPMKLFIHLIHNGSTSLGVRGTVARVTDHPCPMADKRTIDFVDVSEGEVDVEGGPMVTAGQEAKACKGCADPKNPTCCDATNCANGCCGADETCQPGTDVLACGATLEGRLPGGACVACVISQSGAVIGTVPCTNHVCCFPSGTQNMIAGVVSCCSRSAHQVGTMNPICD